MLTPSRLLRFVTAAFLLPAAFSAPARVVISEVMYHPPNDRDELQWIELHNTDSRPVNLAGWSFTKGIQFTFTNATVLPPKGFLVVARDRGAFIIRYGTNITVLGDYRGRISHGGERIELSDASPKTVDAIQFKDKAPWPTSPDGLSATLERINAEGPGDIPENWAPSPLPPVETAAGTPGASNASASTNLPPLVQDVRWTAPSVGRALTVSAAASDPDGVDSVQLSYRVISMLRPKAGTNSRTGPNARGPSPRENTEAEETSIPMNLSKGGADPGRYEASIPPQDAGSLIRFRIVAKDRAGSQRVTPHPHDGRPTWSVYVDSQTNSAAIPFAFMAQHGATERPGESLRTMDWNSRGRNQRQKNTEPSRGDATLVYLAPGSSEPRVFDHIRITPRQAGWKVRLQKDDLLDGMSTVNLIFEYQPRFVLAEHLAYEVYRKAGVPTPLSGHWRTWYNGVPHGYHLFVEQPNSSFLRRVGKDTDGELFKLIWYGGNLIGQHEKKNHPETGHAGLVQTVEALGKSRGPDQWRAIESRFDVPEFVNYYAVNMLVQNWDGFFNNFFLYRGPGAAGKWEIIPWDEDKTWGDYDGASPQYDWYSMPLTFGMAGDKPKMSMAERFRGQTGPHGGPSWWRQGGWFSAPLLANPEFRSRFKTRLRELIETEFTPAKMEGPIAALERALEPEIRYRAEVVGANDQEGNFQFGIPPQNPSTEKPSAAASLERFKRHIQSFRRQVQNRRTFLLTELDREP